MVIKNYIILALFFCLIASQEWIAAESTQTLSPYLQTEDQNKNIKPQTNEHNDNAIDRNNEAQNTKTDASTQQTEEDKGSQNEQRNEQAPLSRNPFDRSAAEPKRIPPNMDNMSDQQLKQYLESGRKDHFRDRQSRRDVGHNRKETKQFKRKHDTHRPYNMQAYCMLGLGVIGTVLFFFCVKKCKKHSKRSMERVMRRRQRSRLQQIVAPQVHMAQPIHNETINSASELSIDGQIRFHQMQLQKLKQFNSQHNKVQGNIPVGQPIYQGNTKRNEHYGY